VRKEMTTIGTTFDQECAETFKTVYLKLREAAALLHHLDDDPRVALIVAELEGMIWVGPTTARPRWTF
jgi:hypothetical protein